MDGFLEVTLVWIHPIHRNLCKTQWPRVGNNIDSRDNMFVYGFVSGLQMRGWGEALKFFLHQFEVLSVPLPDPRPVLFCL